MIDRELIYRANVLERNRTSLRAHTTASLSSLNSLGSYHSIINNNWQRVRKGIQRKYLYNCLQLPVQIILSFSTEKRITILSTRYYGVRGNQIDLGCSQHNCHWYIRHGNEWFISKSKYTAFTVLNSITANFLWLPDNSYL